ncbi:response regulator transcription factor [Streptomyces sp. N35]|uniref:response regulator transcription factor n=1 Tax=Streptomyces sp. N35 TaxID=2795730 RepID=UPI0018F4967D|nr:response regulator transcription factor [Streptomyces sp. N35]
MTVRPPSEAPTRRILVVDDDPTVAEVVTGYLKRAGFIVDCAADGFTALSHAAAARPDLVVLDLMLPGMDGFEVCLRLRMEGPLPVVMLSAQDDERHRIRGLEIGADDYVTKPFSPRELVLRINAVLRRSTPEPPRTATLSEAGFVLDYSARRVSRDGKRIPLTPREFDLLSHFLHHPGQVFSREELIRCVWGWEFGDLSTVTVHIRRLRAKVERDPAQPSLISTVWGTGYRFDAPADGE